MESYSVILQGSEATELDAIQFAQGFDFTGCETEECNTPHKSYVDTVNGIDVYYQYGADYYFFVNSK